MATIKDVARLAGVSTTTVSHVINKTRFVAEATQEKVMKAVDELNYAPSAVARSLKCNSTRTIGMLVTQSTNLFFSEVIDGVESYCYRQGYTLILCNTGGIYEKQRDYIRMLAEKRVDGILVMCSDLTEELKEMLDRHSDIPKVVMDWGPESSRADKIIDNSEEGGYLATKYLIDNGHTDIACLSVTLRNLLAKSVSLVSVVPWLKQNCQSMKIGFLKVTLNAILRYWLQTRSPRWKNALLQYSALTIPWHLA